MKTLHQLDALQAEVGALKRLKAEISAELDALPSILPPSLRAIPKVFATRAAWQATKL